MLDTKALAAATAVIVREHVDAALAPILAENKALQDRIAALESLTSKDITVEAAPFFEEMLERRFSALPTPVDGKDGSDGKDGAGIADLVIDRAGNLVATFTDGRMKELGLIVGKDGRDGVDGKDGIPFGVDDLDMTLMEDGRTLRMAFSKGDTEYAFQVPFPVMLYRGVWREGQEYFEGDTVTWGGSLWHCDKDTSGKPDGGDWTLCAKKGANGKDAR